MVVGDVGTAASNELRSQGERPEFKFPNGLCYNDMKISVICIYFLYTECIRAYSSVLLHLPSDKNHELF